MDVSIRTAAEVKHDSDERPLGSYATFIAVYNVAFVAAGVFATVALADFLPLGYKAGQEAI